MVYRGPMACHHGVEGPCIVCEAVARKRANPTPVQIIPLHLQSDRETGESLCGLAFTECLFATLASHDEERFCRRCLMSDRKRRSVEKSRARAAWIAKPFKEKFTSFTLAVLGTLWAMGLVIGVGVYRDFGSAVAVAIAMALTYGFARGVKRR